MSNVEFRGSHTNEVYETLGLYGIGRTGLVDYTNDDEYLRVGAYAPLQSVVLTFYREGDIEVTRTDAQRHKRETILVSESGQVSRKLQKWSTGGTPDGMTMHERLDGAEELANNVRTVARATLAAANRLVASGRFNL